MKCTERLVQISGDFPGYLPGSFPVHKQCTTLPKFRGITQNMFTSPCASRVLCRSVICLLSAQKHQVWRLRHQEWLDCLSIHVPLALNAQFLWATPSTAKCCFYWRTNRQLEMYPNTTATLNLCFARRVNTWELSMWDLPPISSSPLDTVTKHSQICM